MSIYLGIYAHSLCSCYYSTFSLTIDVKLNDELIFNCRVVNGRRENVVYLEDQVEFERCNTTSDMVTYVASCALNGSDVQMSINDNPDLVNQFRLRTGMVYYFTSEPVGVL